jgi:hypothetical protein
MWCAGAHSGTDAHEGRNVAAATGPDSETGRQGTVQRHIRRLRTPHIIACGARRASKAVVLCAAEDMPGILTDLWEPCQAGPRRAALTRAWAGPCAIDGVLPQTAPGSA